MAKGQCNCGAVQFEITVDTDETEEAGNAGGSGTLGTIYMCHCSICRRMTGAAGVPVLVLRNEDFRWLSGQDQIATWRKPTGDWQCWFCRCCGSPLPGQNDPARIYVPAGLLQDGADRLQVRHHIWTGSKAPWDVIGDGGQQHPEAFGSGT